MDVQSFQEVMQQAAEVGTIVMLVLLAVGIALWLMGRKIARQSIAMSGLVLGAAFAFPISQQFVAGPQMTLAWVIAGAVIGCLLAWLLYRVWMGISMAAILAVTVPVAYVAWFGWPEAAEAAPQQTTGQAAATPVDPAALIAPPPAEEAEPGTDSPAADVPVAELGPDRQGPPASAMSLDLTPEQKEQLDKVRQTLFDHLQQHYQRQRDTVVDWWQQMDPAARHNLLAATAIGAVTGLLLGLLLPNFSASVETSIIGSVMIVTAAWGLLAIAGEDPAQRVPFPVNDRSVLATLGLITAAGIGIQWIMWRKQADK